MNIEQNVLAIKEELNELPPLAIQEIIFDLLKTGAVDYVSLSEMYVDSLKKKNNEKETIINGLAIPLSQYWYGTKMPAKHLTFIRCKAAYNLLKSKIFHTAKIEKEYQELVDKYSYSEDENGHHKINL